MIQFYVRHTCDSLKWCTQNRNITCRLVQTFLPAHPFLQSFLIWSFMMSHSLSYTDQERSINVAEHSTLINHKMYYKMFWEMWGEQKRLRIEPDDWHQKLSNLQEPSGALTGQGVSGCQGLEIRNLEWHSDGPYPWNCHNIMFLFSYFPFPLNSALTCTTDHFMSPVRMIRRDLSSFSFNAGCWMGVLSCDWCSGVITMSAL